MTEPNKDALIRELAKSLRECRWHIVTYDDEGLVQHSSLIINVDAALSRVPPELRGSNEN